MAETVAPNDYRLLFSAFPNVFPSLTFRCIGFTPDLNNTRDPDTLPKAESRARHGDWPTAQHAGTRHRAHRHWPRGHRDCFKEDRHRAAHRVVPKGHTPDHDTPPEGAGRSGTGTASEKPGTGPTTTAGDDTGPEGTGRSDTGTASEKTGTGPTATLDHVQHDPDRPQRPGVHHLC